MVRGSVSTAGATVAKVLCRISFPIISAFVVPAMTVALPATVLAEGLNSAQDPNRGVATSTATPAPAAAGWECLTMQPVLALNGRLVHTEARFKTGGRLTILAIGSSTTAGVGTSSPAAAYPAQLTARLEEKLPLVDIDMHVSGIGGETAVQTLARLEKEVSALKPDLVIWQVGTNDALTSVGEDVFRSLVERGIAAATAAEADLILLDQQFFPTIRDKQRYERFVNLVTEIGLKTKTCVFSRYALMKGWGDQSAVALQAMLSSDGFHMSDRGHACMARLLGREILRAARQGDKPVALADPTSSGAVTDKHTAVSTPGL
ncbi:MULTISPECIES: SGNH/GDSL hydrolase family protein [unclassified Chelatococcus]|uniref:SGNH/GDSL hydrolase family protein n=1 Tax=unclassified Chelatococcus TaxID=2638111 RepID=UPI001BCFCA13|nr:MULTISPECIES: SGNH/GDSL hydrolase family protein [unclassified Chelatococcus]MBS7697899.1 SGNH/GDSL hydrolase family protein [Chelatococcus sp. YT9]MBX3558524.1 SGNH/GDSL hydrolase family protein [Chelatococcus sp.]